MRLTVRHTTRYAFSEPAVLTAELLRLTPQPCNGVTVQSWRVGTDMPGALPSFVDGYGNPTQLLTRRGPHRSITISVEGVAETRDMAGRVMGTPEPLPPGYFLRVTAQTLPDDGIRALADAARGTTPLAMVEDLVATIGARVTYRTGVTDSGTTAAEALAAGAGVCQDHAHILIAAARLRGWPGRYVSGYLWPGVNAREDPASHAWAEVWLDGEGWIGFDPANGVRPNDQYLRLAVGLDYIEAAPVRGVRRGPGDETLAVSVRVDSDQQ